MVAQLDSNLAVEENPDNQLQNQQDDPYEAEETLSLCDLPTYSDSAHWDDFSKDYQSSSFDQDEDNFFEFFSEDFTASTYPSGNKDIIFCGKLIPYNKEAPHVATVEKKTQKNPEQSNKKYRSSTKKWSLFRWRRFRGSKHRVVKPSQVKDAISASATNTISFSASKNYRRCDLSLGKVSILSSNRSKSKWYLYMFGMARFPTEMELRDIKSRQSRRSPSTMFGANCEASDELMGKGNKGISDSSNRAKGLWGLLRAIGCSSQHPNAVVKAASFS
ncbi:uncharacterized protein LOC133716826 [Rosa rugosa]|uniref:uncharacterized protein LOC133716826 n=1 Tax=Rosa rugosa TaxID=74645 RepID=UPI002B40155D|nr:uncharacterized protein LOC133716826 [Rosa rugosa]